jgi:hypothetical protein
VRIIGYCEYSSGLTIAGQYASACTTLQVLEAGVPKPGDMIAGVVSPSISTLTNCATSTSPVTVTSIAISYTPHDAANMTKVDAEVSTAVGAGGGGGFAIFRTGGTNPGQVTKTQLSGNNVTSGGLTLPAFNRGYDLPGSSSSVTYQVECYSNGTGNGYAINPNISPAPNSTISVEEIMGALEPAADERRIRMAA